MTCSVISYGGIPEGDYANPPLTTFSVDTRFAGERLASLLIRRVRGESVRTLRETAEATLLDRGSYGTPALTSKNLAQHLAGEWTT